MAFKINYKIKEPDYLTKQREELIQLLEDYKFTYSSYTSSIDRYKTPVKPTITSIAKVIVYNSNLK